MTSDDIHKHLGVLARIQGLASVDPSLETLIAGQKTNEAQDELTRRINLISQLSSGQFATKSSLWEMLSPDKYFLEQEYVLPKELLVQVHNTVLSDIASPHKIEHLQYGGLLLFGKTVGTGKTDYFRFLAGQLSEKAKFVVAGIDQITGGTSPASVLKTLYKDLDARAAAEGIKYVVLLDEFERLVNKHSKVHSATRVDISETGSDRRHSSNETREVSDKLELDAVGSETFSALKSLISGSEGVEHVYTIATTNQVTFDAALLRRLKGVELKPFGLNTFKDSLNNVPDYSDYGELVPWTLQVLQTAHYRVEKYDNIALKKMQIEASRLFAKLKTKYVLDPNKTKRVQDGILVSSVNTIPAQMAERNNAYFDQIMDFFEISLPKHGDPHYAQISRDFGGVFERPIITKR